MPSVSQKLRLVEWQHALDGFQFEQDRSTDNDVRDIAAIKSRVVIDDPQADLPLERRIGASKLVTQARHINRFKETRTEAPMRAHRQPDDLARDVAAMREVRFHIQQSAPASFAEFLIVSEQQHRSAGIQHNSFCSV
jgi:hypothetical protein